MLPGKLRLCRGFWTICGCGFAMDLAGIAFSSGSEYMGLGKNAIQTMAFIGITCWFFCWAGGF